jgi:type I restriction enzyme, S subunit
MTQPFQEKRLGDVCKTGSGGTPLKAHKDYYEDGTIPWLVSGEVSQGEIHQAKHFITPKGLANSSAKLFPKDTVLIAMYGATAGEVGILRFEASTNQAICGIHPNPNMLPEFLFYFFLHKKAELIAQATGNAQPNISQIKIKNTLIPIHPLPEQKRIVATLDQAFTTIDQAKANVERNLQNAKDLFQSQLNEVFSQNVESWAEMSLEELSVDLITKGATPTTYGFPFVDKGIPFLRSECVSGKGFNPKGIRYISDEAHEMMKRSVVKQGDILISITGNIGRVTRYPTEMDSGNINQHIARVRILKSTADVDFVVYQIQSDVIQSHYQSIYNGAAYPLLSLKQIRETKVFIPNAEKQKQLVNLLNSLKVETVNLESGYQGELDALAELKISILQKAFKGEL